MSRPSADPRFVHLHVHTEYSLLDGACRIDDLAARAAELGFPSLAISDHGALYGVVPFYKACQAAGIKPILGCEVYVAPRSRFDRDAKADADRGHLLLLAEDDTGYRNLMGLVTDSHVEGFYYKPRVDRELLSHYTQGLIGTSACLAGEIPSLILQSREDEARRLAGEYAELLGKDRFFLEIMDHGIPEQARVNAALARMAAEMGLRLLATNDVHYLRQEDAASHDVLLCVQTNATVEDPQRLRFQGDQFYLKSAEEMAAVFAHCPEALAAAAEIGERCHVRLEFGKLVLPEFAVPPGETADSYLRKLCLERLPQRYPGAPEAVRARLEHELRTIADKQLSTYILIVWDLIRYAREQGILVGPGRGSAPGSVVLYLLGVTGIDPVTMGIPFERFINPDRLSMPDIDCDFEDERRQEVIRYITDRYGSDHVAQIITFGTLGPRLALRDAGRAMGVPIPDVDRLAKMVDPMRPIRESVEKNPDVAREWEDNPTARRLLETAMGIEGLARHASTHAAGVVISREPLKGVVPLQRSTEGEGLTTQYDMTAVTEVGLLKVDVLGLRTLSVIKHALELIQRSRGERLDLDAIPYDDPATFELLSRGETAGVFQLESSGMRQVVMELKPDQLEDLIALVALYRPGPMAQIPNYIAGKHGTRPIAYLHPALEPILKDTYGVIVYQEQVMEIARQLAGFSMAAAETLLYAMRKKRVDDMAATEQDFMRGTAARGIDREVAGRIFAQMAEFAGYGFNKAHAASYAINAYQTAYLKAHYPAEFMAAQLTSIMDDKDKVAAYVQECRRMGIRVLPPEVNRSEAGFTVEEGAIRFGLAAAKHVSAAAVEALVAERARGGPFQDLYEMCSRIEPGKLNKLALESLAKCGALAALGGLRAAQVAAVDQALEWGARVYRDRQKGQGSLFGTPDGSGGVQPPSPPLPPVAEFPARELLAMEKDLLGAYLSGHPLEAARAQLAAATTATTREVREGTREGALLVGGIVTSVRKRVTRAGKMMAFLTLEDLTGATDVVVRPEGYERCSAALMENAILVVRGYAERDERWREEQEAGGSYQLIAQDIAPLDDPEGLRRLRNGGASGPRSPGPGRPGRKEARPGPKSGGRSRAHGIGNGAAAPSPQGDRPASPEEVHIRLPSEELEEKMEPLKAVIVDYPGDTRVLLRIALGEQERRVRLGEGFRVSYGRGFVQAVEELLGQGAVWLEQKPAAGPAGFGAGPDKRAGPCGS